jgi:hypothetical protein
MLSARVKNKVDASADSEQALVLHEMAESLAASFSISHRKNLAHVQCLGRFVRNRDPADQFVAGAANLSRRFLSCSRQSADQTEPPSAHVLDECRWFGRSGGHRRSIDLLVNFSGLATARLLEPGSPAPLDNRRSDPEVSG